MTESPGAPAGPGAAGSAHGSSAPTRAADPAKGRPPLLTGSGAKAVLGATPALATVSGPSSARAASAALVSTGAVP